MYNPATVAAAIEELGASPPPGKPHGIALPGTEKPNRSQIYRHWQFADRPLLETLDPAVRTLHDLFESSVQQFPRNACLGARKWLPDSKTWDNKFSWLTYAEVAERRKNFGAGIVELHERLNFTKKSQYPVPLWAPNKPEWQIVELGCMSQGLFTVSLYETLGPDTTEFILNHVEASCIVASLPHIPGLLEISRRLPHLKMIISIDPLDNGEQEAYTKRALLSELASQRGLQLYSLDEVERLGFESQRPMRPCSANDIYTINYTSGTTGVPKGVIVTHKSALSSNCVSRIMSGGVSSDVGLSYLPLAHLLQRLVEQEAFASGSRTGYFRGDLTGLPDDIKLLRPTTFISVPRVFNRFNAAIRAASIEAPGFKGALSRHVIDSKLATMKLPMGQAYNTHWLYDRLWTSKVKAAMGFDRLRAMAGGSAPIDPQVQTFLGAALGIPFAQGYGMTESSGVATCQLKGDFETGHVGPPMPCVEICLESVPDLDYRVEDQPRPRGEVLMRGPSIFSGYLKNDAENAKVLEPDGWFHTGDIAEIDELGRVRIIDRKKNILKMSQGEYVAPERIENIYAANCGMIANGLVHGDSSESTLVGIFGVEPEPFAAFAGKILGREVSAADVALVREVAAHPKVKREFLRILEDIGKKKKLSGYERIKNLTLAVDPFSVENELLTPTLKLKRQQAAKVYRADIVRMYKEIAESAPVAKL
ncbi:AMP-dependent synthetase/ligase [Cordyceps fumosorosea ARSEF 2679]|uniref:AMP-dependent synthetase/ligase n=1 Tax=Cordyceps fumosorosea (strain ARSEF 2679) TaxID=1081104 RepID=A0A168BQ04_CORFA|nr:AMP-dependent synthetase/ligase [Cordyceps fumosorosea ARSEF 2679]OAA70403.1 AMP-dependent synthetase/ligase [Cordyceps fumosorosea ARSEF 2679]